MYTTIKQQFCEVIEYSQCINTPNVDKLFDNWARNKQRLIDIVLNGNLIYELPEEVTFSLDESTRMERVDFLCANICNRYGNRDLADFINQFAHCFFSRLTDEDYDFEGVTIKKGVKIIKAFKYFVKDQKILEEIQNMASRIIQEDKITGKLCLSVHPLDFLSTSENTHNWRSCHSLDGDYRVGNLGYMQDRCTVICYLKSKDNAILPNFPATVPWNDKKWRMLLFIDKHNVMLFAGRQYPFSIKGIFNYVEKLLPFHVTDWESYYLTAWNGVHLDRRYLLSGNDLVAIDDLIVDSPGSLHFNDLINSSCYVPYYTYVGDYKPGATRWRRPVFELGHSVTCLYCGKETLTEADQMVCEYCIPRINAIPYNVCACCDRPMHPDEDTYTVADETLCYNCYKNSTCNCDICGRRAFNIFITYNMDMKKMVCNRCGNQPFEIEF